MQVQRLGMVSLWYARGMKTMPMVMNGTRYYRTSEVYRMAGISRNTLFNWLQRGVVGEPELRDRRGW